MHYSYFYSITILSTYWLLTYFSFSLNIKKNLQELSLSFKVQSDFFRNACAEYWIMNDLSSRLWNMNWMHLYFSLEKNGIHFCNWKNSAAEHEQHYKSIIYITIFIVIRQQCVPTNSFLEQMCPERRQSRPTFLNSMLPLILHI